MNADATAPSQRIECDERAGVLRVHDPRLFQADQRALCRRLVEASAGRAGVRRARVDLVAACVELEFEHGSRDTRLMADAFVNALRAATVAVPPRAARGKGKPERAWLLLSAARLGEDIAVVETYTLAEGTAIGWKRLRYLALAGGSFALTVVGLVVPGIPTVPFLLTTSYYLARSSPRLDAKLRRAPIFGPVLQEWETEGGLSQLSKGKLAGLTLSIVAVTLILAPLSPVLVIVVILMSSVGLAGLLRLPGVSTSPTALEPPRDARGLIPLTAV